MYRTNTKSSKPSKDLQKNQMAQIIFKTLHTIKRVVDQMAMFKLVNIIICVNIIS